MKDQIDRVNKEAGWVALEEAKPEKYEYVLVSLKSPSAEWVELAGFDGENFQLPGRGNTEFVTHWMPKPLPALAGIND